MTNTRAFMIVFAAVAMLQLTAPLGSASAAPCPYTPARGTPERSAIMDAVRPSVRRALGQRVQFVVQTLSVCGSWAFLEAEPQKRNGRPIDWSLSSYADAVADDVCGQLVHALLVKRSGQWHVVTQSICATDVVYATWWRDHGAPRRLFPYTE